MQHDLKVSTSIPTPPSSTRVLVSHCPIVPNFRLLLLSDWSEQQIFEAASSTSTPLSQKQVSASSSWEVWAVAPLKNL
jgi:hypothetical protein